LHAVYVAIFRFRNARETRIAGEQTESARIVMNNNEQQQQQHENQQQQQQTAAAAAAYNNS